MAAFAKVSAHVPTAGQATWADFWIDELAAEASLKLLRVRSLGKAEHGHVDAAKVPTRTERKILAEEPDRHVVPAAA